MIYLDNNATTAISPEVLESMQPFLTSQFMNPSSMYEAARPVKKAIDQSREAISKNLGTLDSEIIFTSCATESLNAAMYGVAQANPNRKHIITTAVEHPAVLEVCKDFARRGFDVSVIGVNRNGEINIGDFVRELRHDTLFVAVMHANNETGVVFPIERLARVTKETDPAIVFVCDATQTMTKLPIQMNGNFRNVDIIAFSGHKFHAPKGIGALVLRRGTRWRPFLIGGHQESGRRGGTENVPYIVGMAKAIELAAQTHDSDIARMESQRNQLQEEILQQVPSVEVNGGNAERMPNTLNVAVHCVEGEGILYQLSEFGICASSGSACTSGSLEPSHVLSAMHIPFTAMHGSVRISLSRYTSENDVQTFLEQFPPIIHRLRRLSPYWDQKNNKPR
ncbi:MAG: aminotransferase class V-fold PLP-dependent enzyme [Thermoguttaceae bacterium]